MIKNVYKATVIITMVQCKEQLKTDPITKVTQFDIQTLDQQRCALAAEMYINTLTTTLLVRKSKTDIEIGIRLHLDKQDNEQSDMDV